MSLLSKVLIGAAVVGVGVAVIDSIISDTPEEKKEEKVIDITEIKVNQEDDTIFKKIKRFVKKKVVKFLTWVTLHMEQIEAAGAVIGLAGACISITGSVRDFVRSNDLNDRLARIEDKLDQHDILEIKRNDALGKYVQNCTEVLNDNLKTTDKDVIKLADNLGYKLLKDNEVFE